jgi:hypothetical protein
LEGAGMIADTWRFVSKLCSNVSARRYTGLKIIMEILPDEYHGSAVSFSRALRALYPPVRADSTATRSPCSGG